MVAAPGGAFDPRGPVAREIADLWWVLLALGVATFAVFAAVLVTGLLRGRGSTEDSPGDRPNRMILLGGVALPTVVLAVVLVLTVASMRRLPSDAPEGALRVEVIGHMWWWEIRYPEHEVVTANEVHLPAGRPVELRLTSADVIHSFWVPALAGKMDLLPEDVNTLVLEADEPGVHWSLCAEFCGLQHAKMGLVTVVEPAEQFATWLEQQRAPAGKPRSDLARTGRDVFFDVGCASCHTVRGTRAAGEPGPDLTHLASRTTLAAATLRNTTEHLRSWVTEPQSIKRGVAMPNLDVGKDELEALLAYLEDLE